MEYGTVIAIERKTALVIFENAGIQKKVKIPKHIEGLKITDRVAVIFETKLSNGIIAGVMENS